MVESKKPFPFPKIITQALSSSPIEISSSLIDRKLRNKLELSDLSELIRKFQTNTPKLISLGLYGSRTDGDLYYSPEKLGARLCFTYNKLTSIVDVEEYELFGWERIQNEVITQVEPLAIWLEQQAKKVTTLNQIQLNQLPPELRSLVMLEPLMVGTSLFPEGTPFDKLVFPYPAAFYPDIDILAIVEGEPGQTFYDMEASRMIGPQSGSFFHLHHLPVFPGQSDDDFFYQETALEQYRPFSFPSKLHQLALKLK